MKKAASLLLSVMIILGVFAAGGKGFAGLFSSTEITASAYDYENESEKKYTVYYWSGDKGHFYGGDELYVQKYYEGETIKPPVPISYDYNFKGWKGLPDTMPDHDIDVEAKWTKITIFSKLFNAIKGYFNLYAFYFVLLIEVLGWWA